MVDESTPLNAATATAAATAVAANVTTTADGHVKVGGVDVDTKAIKAAAAAVLTKENADKAKVFAKAQYDKLKKIASDGNMSLTFLALVGGVAMMVTSIMGVVGRFLTLSWIGALFDVYIFFFGVLVVFLEWKKFPGRDKYNMVIHTYFHFLDYIWGRGVLYFVAGSLQFSLFGLLDLAVGGFMCFVGILYIIVGKIAHTKFVNAKEAMLSEHTIAAKFNEADVEDKGSINLEQFEIMTKSLGMELEKREVEIAFLEIPKVSDKEDRITLESFKNWWTKADTLDFV
mmetsp:Transcript_7034/g.10393  ORF Transcript_7034/g.10393 Transcript_7034/m.10393 type:complete len:286 (+) Transcript_7034:45-902(+)